MIQLKGEKVGVPWTEWRGVFLTLQEMTASVYLTQLFSSPFNQASAPKVGRKCETRGSTHLKCSLMRVGSFFFVFFLMTRVAGADPLFMRELLSAGELCLLGDALKMWRIRRVKVCQTSPSTRCVRGIWLQEIDAATCKTTTNQKKVKVFFFFFSRFLLQNSKKINK